jgi:hypothetical protein
MGSQLREIEKRAVSGCSSLKSIRIPASVPRLEPNSFGNCERLMEFLIEYRSKLSKRVSIDEGMQLDSSAAQLSNAERSTFATLQSLANVTLSRALQPKKQWRAISTISPWAMGCKAR